MEGSVSTPAAPVLERRAVVPSLRELARGVEAPPDFAPVRATSPTFSWSWRDLLHQLDPRGIAGGGPIYPLALLLATTFVAAFDAGLASRSIVTGSSQSLLGPELKDYFGISIDFIFRIGAILNVVGLFLGLAGGFISDRVPRVYILRFGALVGGAAGLALPLFPILPVFVASTVIGSIVGTFTAAAGAPLLFDWYPPGSRARIIAFLGLSATLMGVIGLPIGGAIALHLGWRMTLLVFGVLTLLLGVGTFWLREPVRGRTDRLAMGATEEVARREQQPMSLGESWRAAFSIVTLRRIWYAGPFIEVFRGGLGTLLIYYLAGELHMDVQARALFFVPGSLAAGAALVVGGAYADRLLAYRPGRLMSATGVLTLLSALAMFLLVLTKNATLAMLAYVPIGFMTGVLAPAQATLTAMVVPARIRGFALAANAPFTAIGLVAAPLIIAPIAAQVSYGAGLAALLPFAAVGCAIYVTSSLGVDRDIRVALAASMADEEVERALESGRAKMLVCRDVDVEYDGVRVVFHLDFDIEEGDVVALMGTNGSGKSTVLKAVCGLQQAANGAIFMDGREITHAPPHENARRGLVMMPGGRAVFPTLSVADNLKVATWLEDNQGRIAQVLEMFPALRERLAVQAGNLSGGEQQMLALAQTFLMKPRLLMIDELSLGLAPQVVDQLMAALARLRDEGTTIVVVEQTVSRALSLARRAVFMEKGEIRFDGEMAELGEQSDLLRSVFLGHAVTATSLGSRTRPLGPEESSSLLRIEGLSVTYGGVRAVDGVSLDCASGEVLGVIGANGAGKTSLFDAISGFVRPESGTVWLDGADITRLGVDARARRGLIRAFQDVRLFPALTVRENLAIAFDRRLEVKNMALAAIWAPNLRAVEKRLAQRVQNLVESLGLTAFADKFAGELSTGSRRVVEIGCLLAASPKLLLLDEPSSGLAQAETEALGPLIGRIVKETGCGVLVIEHDLALVSALSNRLLFMERGAAVAVGSPAEIIADPRVQASYTGGAAPVPAT